MEGKKAAIIFVSIVVFFVIAIVAAFQIFYAVYEPKHLDGQEVIEVVD